jgi:hypothetical protein
MRLAFGVADLHDAIHSPKVQAREKAVWKYLARAIGQAQIIL